MMKHPFSFFVLMIALAGCSHVSDEPKGSEESLPTEGLVAYWPFNGNANDESGNGNDLTVHNAALTPDRKGYDDKAYSFDGSNSYIAANNNSIGNFTDSVTICFWLNTNQPGSWSRIIGKDNYSWWEFSLSDGVYFSISFDNVHRWDTKILSQEQMLNSWNFLVVTVESYTQNAFINGIAVPQVSISGNSVNNSQALTLGRSSYWNNAYFTGQLDDVRIYDRVLTESEISALYHEG
jgi:trimeric autotransporter adhesin